MKRIVVLGGSSFIGLPILKKLSTHKEWDVIGTYHQNQPLEDLTLEKVDLLNSENVKKFLKKKSPDTIIHCAALSNVDQCQKNRQQCYLHNVAPVKTILEYCRQNSAVKYIFFSSSEVFDGKKGKPFAENDKTSSLNQYGKYKIEAEELILSLENKTIIRPCLVYGIPEEYQHRNIFNYIYKSLNEGKSITVYQDMIRTPTYVQDLPLIVESIIENDKRGIFHAGGQATSIYNFAKEIAQYFGFPPDQQKLIIGKSCEGHEVDYKPRDNRLDCSHTEKELGIKFRSLQEASADIKKELAKEVLS